MREFNGFTEKASRSLNLAVETAMSLGHTYVGSEHILYGLCAEKDSVAGVILSNQNIDCKRILKKLEALIGKGIPTKLGVADFTPRSKKIIERAALSPKQNRCSGTEEILREIAVDEKSYGYVLLRELGADIAEIIGECSPEIFGSEEKNAYKSEEKRRKNEYLTKYARDLTALAREGKLDPLIGRETEIRRVIQSLLQRRKNNPCLIGDSGVGKTAIVEGLAVKIAQGDVPELLSDKQILMLDLTLMLAGAKYRGDFEERIKRAIDEAIADKTVILFIDEIHSIVGTGAAEGAIDAANILKPYLARGEIQLIGATTSEEYRRFIEKDSALERRFQPVAVDEPSVQAAKDIIKGLKGKYEQHHGVNISDEAIEAAVELSTRYINDRFLPDKAIDLIDEAASMLRLKKTPQNPISKLKEKKREITEKMFEAVGEQDYETAAELQKKESELSRLIDGGSGESGIFLTLTSEDIAEVVEKKTGIPVRNLGGDNLFDLEDRMKRTIIGQDEAVKKVINAIKRFKAGLSNDSRPIGAFMFLGPTGVGKTFLCKALAKEYYGDERAMVRLDMSEYMEKSSVSKLIGAPPGYVGFDNGGYLIEKIRRRPYSLVLFDEIEKAHPDVLNLLLQILEDGILTSSDGRKADFTNSLIVMTGNVGANEITSPSSKIGFSEEVAGEYKKETLTKKIKESFSPEFLNRIDEIVYFKPLEKDELEKIASAMLEATLKKACEKGIDVSVQDGVVELLAREGFDKKSGARPLRRIITEQIENPLCELLLKKELNGAVIATQDGKIIIKQLQTNGQSDKM